MDSTVITYRLDLAVQLLDTTTGRVIEEHNVRFQRDGHPIRPLPRGGGTYIFTNSGRMDFTMQVAVSGYETKTVEIVYERLDNRVPIQAVFLIPSENTAKGETIMSFSGHLSGLEEIEAISLGYAPCTIQEFDERKRIMKVFQKGKGAFLEDVFYGLLSKSGESYERVEIIKETANGTYKVRETLKEPFSINSPLSRIVFGKVDSKGEYLLRVRDMSEDLRYLVRYMVDGEERFQVVDFRQLEGVRLQ